MRIFHNYSPGLAFQPRFKLGDNPVGSLISGMFGFAGTQATNETNEDIADWQLAVQMAENQKNRDYNTAEAEKARNFEAIQAQIGRDFTTSEREAQQQFQQQQWEYQQRNQLALQMQGARDAGLNPNVAAGRVMSAQGGSVSAPTGASSPMPGAPLASYSGGLSPVPFQAQNPAMAFAQAAQGLASLATAKEKGANVSLIEKQVENMAVDTQYKHVLIDGLKLTQALSKIDLKYHEKKLVQDLTEQVARITSINNTAELSAATAKVQDSLKRLNEVLIGKHSQEATLLALEIGAFDKRLQKQLELQGAQIKEANAKAFEAGETARLQKQRREFAADLQPYQKQVARAEAYIKQSTSPEVIKQAEQETKRQQWFNTLLQNKNLGQVLENKDRAAYTAFQRLVRGKGMDGDVATLLRALQDVGEGVEFVK